MLKKLFPPPNELTVFVISITLLSLFLYMDQWALKAALLSINLSESLLNNVNDSVGIIDKTKSVLVLIFTLILVVAVIFGPLFLPFNQKDLRGLCTLTILTDAALITYFNIGLANESPTIINGILAFYSFSWVVFVLVVIRMKKLDFLMSNDQAKAIPSIVAASISVVFVFIAIKGFSVHWVKAYSIGSIATSILFSLCSDLYYEWRYNKARNPTVSPPVR